jgi:Glycosyl transferase family 2
MRSDKPLLPTYELARRLAEGSSASRIIHIGAGSTDSLKHVGESCEHIWFGASETESLIRNQFPAAKFIPASLEGGLPEVVPTEIFDNSVVLCLDVLHRLTDPGPLIIQLGKIRRKCSWLIITTPDRFRTSGLIRGANTGWSADEFGRYLLRCGFSRRMLIGFADSDDSQGTKNTVIVLAGKEAEFTAPRRRTKTAAIIHVFNEVDILENVARYLCDQDIDVHLIDNWSTDGSYERGQELVRVGICSRISRFPDRPSAVYEWERQLKHTQQYAASLDADWIMHYDADEIRCSPWEKVPLSRAIDFVDGLNYTAIDFTVINFLFTDESAAETSTIEDLRSFEWGRHPAYFQQIKAWKNLSIVDLASSGGHDAQFEGRRIYPLKFLTKHYPLRSYNQANRKLYRDRFPRIWKEQAEKEWHVHYGAFQLVPELKPWRKHELLNFDHITFNTEFLIERISGIGVDREPHNDLNIETQILLEQKLISKARELRRRLAAKACELRRRLAAQETLLRGQLDQRGHQVNELEAQLRQAVDEGARQREQVASLNRYCDEIERQRIDAVQLIDALHASRSWRVTAPIRGASLGLRKVMRNAYLVAALAARGAYRALPLPLRLKIRLKHHMFDRMGPIFARTGAYQRWQNALRQEPAPVPEASRLGIASATHSSAEALPRNPGHEERTSRLRRLPNDEHKSIP